MLKKDVYNVISKALLPKTLKNEQAYTEEIQKLN